MTDLKVIFSGMTGCQISTAMETASGAKSVEIDAGSLVRLDAKITVPAATLGYAEMSLPVDQTLVLLGMSSQEKFSLLRTRLSEAVQGAVILVDNSRLDPLGDLVIELASFDRLLLHGCVVIGIVRGRSPVEPSLEAHRVLANASGFAVPVFDVDVRRRLDMVRLLDALLPQIGVDRRG